jgi:hypothetical protein
MPKTYNQRQIDQMRVEAAYAPPLPDDGPDVTRYIRFFSGDEIAALIDRIMARVAADRPTHLKPDTAYLVARALRMWMAEPRREAIVREICGVPGGCADRHCVGCIGKANAIMGLYEGRKVR